MRGALSMCPPTIHGAWHGSLPPYICIVKLQKLSGLKGRDNKHANMLNARLCLVVLALLAASVAIDAKVSMVCEWGGVSGRAAPRHLALRQSRTHLAE